MPKPDHDPSIEREPHRGRRPARPDPSELAADRTLSRSSGSELADDLAKQSVFDEPDILPGRDVETIDQDWSCAHCGYNLRGLPTGHRCPECGHMGLYRPPPPGEVSFGAWYLRRRAGVSSRRSWAVAVVAAMLAAPAAVPGAFFMTLPLPITALILGPFAEELVKILAIVLLVDAKPYLIRHIAQIQVAAGLSALAYAVVYSALSLAWFTATPPVALILWRWTGSIALHVGCTAVAATGLASAWHRADREARTPRIAPAARSFTLAGILHAGFNALLFFWVAPRYVF